MKKILLAAMSAMMLVSCSTRNSDNSDALFEEHSNIEGTWKLVYAETRDQDSVEVRDITTTDFIKIINKTHFAFLSQDRSDASRSYGGGGTYTYNGDQYIEKLEFTALESYKNKSFPFTLKIEGDSLTQYGTEEIKEENIKKYIVEKYIKIK